MSKRRWPSISSYENVKLMKLIITQLRLLVYLHTQLLLSYAKKRTHGTQLTLTLLNHFGLFLTQKHFNVP